MLDETLLVDEGPLFLFLTCQDGPCAGEQMPMYATEIAVCVESAFGPGGVNVFFVETLSDLDAYRTHETYRGYYYLLDTELRWAEK